MQWDWQSVGIGAFLAISLAACGGNGASTGSTASGGSASAGDPQTASCAGATAGANSAMAFHPSAKLHGMSVSPMTTDAGLSVVQTVPAPGTDGADLHSPMVLFFDGAVDTSTITPSTLQITGSSSSVKSYTTAHSCSHAGNSVLAILPDSPFAPTETVTVNWSGIKDKNGHPVTPSFSQFGVATSATNVDASTLDFDHNGSLPLGVACTGDCGIRLGSFGDADPTGIFGIPVAAYISTGTAAGLGSAITGTTSALTLHGLINAGGTFSFKYRFISGELPHWYGQIFDDVFMVALSGPNGTIVKTMTSVNRLGDDISQLTLGTFDENGTVNQSNVDSGHQAMMSGLLTGTVDASSVGSPMSVMFYVSDVGDGIVDSVVQLNAIKSVETH